MKVNPVLLIFLAVGSFFLFREYVRMRCGKTRREPEFRLRRIKKVGFVFQFLIAFSLSVGLYSVLAFLCGGPFFSQYPARMVVAPGHIYTALAEMPGNILALMLVKIGLGFAAAAVLFALFGLYRRGILFSARNVLYIRFQGYYLILNFIVDYQMQGALHDLVVSTTPFFLGFFVIFIAWIMDEGRKIQEEQALTV
jgi:hypothetical protein